MKRVFVVGSIVVDLIKKKGDRGHKSFGGITYSVVALSRLLPDREIVPVTFVGKGERTELLRLFAHLDNVNTNYILDCQESNTNEIFYPERGGRIERFHKKTPPIPILEVKEIFQSEAILINFIKDDDLKFEDLKAISYSYRGLLYMDVHSLLRKVTDEGTFRLKPIQNWPRWASLPDVIQMNLSELHTLTDLRSKSMEELKTLAQLVLNQGPRIVTVTMGRRGSLTLWRDKGEVRCKRSIPPKVEVVDPTGAGDTYGAAFLSALIKEMSPDEATDYANQKASSVVSGWGIKPLFDLK
jgi:sugar/nucleoside kinase (ribokinase family)